MLKPIAEHAIPSAQSQHFNYSRGSEVSFTIEVGERLPDVWQIRIQSQRALIPDPSFGYLAAALVYITDSPGRLGVKR